MSDPTYQRVGPSQGGGNLHDVWDASDEGTTDPDPMLLERLRASPTSVTSRADHKVSEVLRRFPRPGANAPVRASRIRGPAGRTIVIFSMVLVTSICTVGAWVMLTGGY